MSSHILICINPKQHELIENIQKWCKENLKYEDKKVELVYAHCSMDKSLLAGPEAAFAIEHLIELNEENFSEFEKEMNHLTTEFNEKLNIHVTSTILRGLDPPYKQLSEYAKKVNADLLIIGSRDLSFWKRIWTSSFSDSILHEVHCPVIITKPKATNGNHS